MPVRRRCLGLALLLAWCAPALRAQVPDAPSVDANSAADSVAVTDSLAVPDAPALDAQDTLGVPLSAFAPPPGAVTGPVPATQPGLSVLPLLADAPGAFRYDLGSPGWPHGLSVFGAAPRRGALTLGGVPFSDLVTGRPRFDLLPLDLLGRLHREPTAHGATPATHTAVRPLDAPVARTELRYLTGQEGMQFISATHAQTRRPGFAGRAGRLGVLFHVSGQSADGFYNGSGVGGYRVLVRATLNRPRYALEVTEYRTRLGVGARGALSGALYDPLAALVPTADAERVDLLHLLAARLRWQTGLLPEPAIVTGFRVAQTARYARTGGSDATAEAEAQRWGLALDQPLALGRLTPTLRAALWRDAALDSTSAAVVPAPAARTFAHVSLADSTALLGTALRLGVGLHATPEGAFPSAYAEAFRPLGPLRLEATLAFAGAAYGRAEVAGYVPGAAEGVPLGADPDADLPVERHVRAGLGLQFDAGAFRVGLRATGAVQRTPRVLLGADGDAGGTFATLDGSVRRVVGTASLAFRPEALRGLYASAQASAHQGAWNGAATDQPTADQFLAALPDAWGTAQVGVRALGVFDGVLDLDVALQGRAWTSFASRAFHGPTALFPLPTPATVDAPTGGTLGLVLNARLQKRASLYLVYENALAERAYAGTFLVPVYPLTPHHLRFGVFWTLFG